MAVFGVYFFEDLFLPVKKVLFSYALGMLHSLIWTFILPAYRLSILTYLYGIEFINFMVNHPFDITDIPTTWRYVLPFWKLVAYLYTLPNLTINIFLMIGWKAVIIWVLKIHPNTRAPPFRLGAKIVNTIGIQYMNLYTTDLFSMGKWQILCNFNTYSNFRKS